jgi:hypothetical protein
MKSLQMIIYTALKDRYLYAGKKDVQVKFVHPIKKTNGALPGPEGYKERKQKAIQRAKEYLRKEGQYTWLEWLEKQGKKDDLCDSLCMMIDVMYQ